MIFFFRLSFWLVIFILLQIFGFLDVVINLDWEIVVINRRGQEDVAMIAASELSTLLETAYLLRSPKNAQHLLEAMRSSLSDEGTPATVEELRREFGLDREA